MASRILHRIPTSTPSLLPHLHLRSTPMLANRTLHTTRPLLAEGDLGNPQSSSSEQQSLKKSRATGGQNSPDTASVQQPVSDRSAIPGEKDEGTPTEEKMKRDPEEPAEVKRESVESQGKKPLGPEDHQK